MGLNDLPVELLYEVQAYALSPSLPLASKRLHAVFEATPPTFRAKYLIGRYISASEHERIPTRRKRLITVILRYPACNQDVLEAVSRSRDYASIESLGDRKSDVIELPRRLFRHLVQRSSQEWSEDDEPIPFLRYLFTHKRIPPPFPDSYDGYALTRAVYAGSIPLVRFLLSHDASPECKDGMAVQVAVKRKDLSLVRMLIEPDPSASTSSTDGEATRKGKRRKLADRVQVTPRMLKTAVKVDARNIVDYFMEEKGCIPDMQTVLLMSNLSGFPVPPKSSTRPTDLASPGKTRRTPRHYLNGGGAEQRRLQ